MDGATKERLRRGAAELGVPLDEAQVKKFARYLELLLVWNRKMNLTAVDDPERVIELFERLGYRRSFRYQKYRTGYSVPLGGRVLKVLFDETPIGSFIEIEGDENSVLKALDTAGFSAGDIIRESYPELQAARCKALGIPLEDLIF